MVRSLGLVAAAWVLFVLPVTAGDTRVRLSMEDLESPAFAARRISLELTGADLDRLRLAIGELSVGGRSWRDVGLECGRFSLSTEALACFDGTWRAPDPVAATFSYSMASGRFDVRLSPKPGELWTVAGKAAGGTWNLAVSVVNGDAARLAGWLPRSIPRPTAGIVGADFRASGRGDQWSQVEGRVDLSGLAFSDESGLHAGEKIAGRGRLVATRRGEGGEWAADAEWTSGGIFWQPVYLSGGGYRISAHGALAPDRVGVSAGTAVLGSIGAAEFSGEWDSALGGVARLALRAPEIELAPLMDVVGRPFLQDTALAEAEALGQAAVELSYERGELQSARVELRHAALLDARERFLLGGVNARLPWSRSEAVRGEITIGAGHLLRVPYGPAMIPLEIQPGGFSVAAARIPLLEGELTLENFAAEREASGWRWSLGGGLSPVSMKDLTNALGIHVMHGTLSAVVPRVRYAGATLEVDGALLINAFDGTAVISGLSMQEPLGRAPRLRAEVDMRGLDLDLLTRTFDFGSMQGKVDVAVRGLELSNWRPVALDARVESSPGSYPKKISQRAVQNISALGGAGAAAAIQRSFIGIFEQFGYSRLGLSCRLERGVCHMAGIEDVPSGYVIVKGGGIPALTVMGYNRTVGWNELLARLQRITQENVKPVIK
jgi:hypothetical protein